MMKSAVFKVEVLGQTFIRLMDFRDQWKTINVAHIVSVSEDCAGCTLELSDGIEPLLVHATLHDIKTAAESSAAGE